MSRREVAGRIAASFGPRALREYVRWKVRANPAYDAVAERLRGRTNPVVNIGCGIGLLAHFLRASGIEVPIDGVNFDARKIAAAREAAAGLAGVTFARGDARQPFPAGRDVIMLDILHYFSPGDQQRILANAAAAVPAGGIVLIREGLRDSSWRYALTWFVNGAARLFRWMKAERLHFPTRDEITAAFPGFQAEITPLWGKTPYNGYLFVFRRGEG